MSEIIPTPEGATELTQLRGLRHKVFALPNGKKRLVQKLGMVHYPDEQDGGTLKDIVMAFRDKAGTGDTIADALPFRFRLHQTGIGFDYESRLGGVCRVALVGIDGLNNFDRRISYNKTRSGRVLTFPDVRTDLDIQIRLNRSGLSVFRVLKSANAPRNFRWAIEYDEAGEGKIDKEIRGKDAQKRRLELTLNNSTPQLQPSGRYRYFATESWTGKVRVIDPDTHVPSWQDVAEYPVYIDPDITEEIVNLADDGMSYGSSWFNDIGGSIYFGEFSNNAMDPGFRWRTVAVPQGATIDNATLKINVTGSSTDYGAGTLWGDDSDDAATWQDSTRPATRTKTTASVPIPKAGSTGIKSYTVTDVVQEIVNRPGWVSGNDLALFIINDGANSRFTIIEDFSNAGTNEPTLEIDYTEGGGGAASRRAINQRFTATGSYAAQQIQV